MTLTHQIVAKSASVGFRLIKFSKRFTEGGLRGVSFKGSLPQNLQNLDWQTNHPIKQALTKEFRTEALGGLVKNKAGRLDALNVQFSSMLGDSSPQAAQIFQMASLSIFRPAA